MEKRKLHFWEIWNMSFGFLGIQFGFALQGGFMSRIFQTLGAEVDDIPGLWVAAPLTGLLVQPIVGYLSDNTWSPEFGRRKPFFLIGAILASITLFFMPHSPALWIAAGLLWVLDSSINISMEPFRALVADKLPELFSKFSQTNPNRSKEFNKKLNFNWVVCDDEFCFSGSGDTAYFSQVNIFDTVKVCYDAGTCYYCESLVFTQGAWIPLKDITSIHEIANTNTDGRIYDLLGRELKSIPVGRMYIMNNRLCL